METEKQRATRWSNVQLGGLATVCLLLGLATGYLVYSPSRPALQNAAPAAQGGAAPAQPNVTPEQLQHMANKKAEPLLAELQKNPNDARVLSQLAQVYFYAKQVPPAVQYMERAAKIKPDAENLNALAAMYHYAGNDKKAIDTLNRVLQIDPKFDGALFNLGMLKWQAEGDTKGAVQAWEKLLATHPNHPQRAQIETLIAQVKKHEGMGVAKPAAASK
jgi:cytochrome c-type biogenesis protein CcmH/NrfG